MTKILEGIDNPKDLKKLKLEELEKLSEEVRDLIVKTVAENPGHLASNLGIVELTILLHYYFNFKRDKIVWDVGHQTYAHKILTGRKEDFKNLRQYDGLSGFPNKYESEYDPFTSGHSGNAISSALGISCANDILKKQNYTIAVVGDGGIGTGMSLEALNHAGDLKKNLIVILNDNEMSISNTIGAVSKYLNSLRTTKTYSEIRKDFNELFSIIPSLGRPVSRTMENTIDLIKKNATFGKLFIELGFNYFGPVDGHNFEEMLKTMNIIKKLNGPILLHTITQKGKGFDPALENPSKYHSAGKFDASNGLSNSKGKKDTTYTDVFAKTVINLAKNDKKIVSITAAMPDGTGSSYFAKKFPNRFYDAGICEQHAIGLANGLSSSNLKPVVAIYSTFLQRGYDQVFHDVCLQNNNVVLAIDRAGIVGSDGATHNGCFDIAYLRHLPNITLMAPKDGKEMKSMLEYALNLETPVAIRYPREKTPNSRHAKEPIQIGKAEVLKEGEDAVILAYGSMVSRSLEASKMLKKENINVGVINARFAKPLDEKLLLNLIEQKSKIFTVEDHTLVGGFGSAVLEFVSDNNGDIQKISRIGIPDKFIEHGPRDLILEHLELDPEGIRNKIKQEIAK